MDIKRKFGIIDTFARRYAKNRLKTEVFYFFKSKMPQCSKSVPSLKLHSTIIDMEYNFGISKHYRLRLQYWIYNYCKNTLQSKIMFLKRLASNTWNRYI